MAARYVTRQGARVLAKNYRCRQGEIDLVVQDGEYLVFCEVKFRKDPAMGTPQEAVGYAKQRKICRVAMVYRAYRGLPLGTPIRYDVIAIQGDEINWIKNAFPHCE